MACSVADDQPDGPVEGTGGDAATCVEIAQITAESCVAPESLVGGFVDNGGTVVQIDDPEASVGIGPNAWLVSVSGSADWVGSSVSNGVSCTFGCGYCDVGQSLCHSGIAQDGTPGCFTCFNDNGEDPAAVIDACTNFVAVECGEAGLDETGDGEDGLDDTGDGEDGLDETDGGAWYDCTQWNPKGAVSLDIRGTATIDRATVETIADYFGDPLGICDDTGLRQRADGTFVISRMAPGGLLAQMGLKPGDAILAVDGIAMDDLDAIANTAVELFLDGPITKRLSLMVGRGRRKFEKRIIIR